MTAEVLLQGILSGLLMGLVYALIAAGLSLIFGLMEIVNFAHGDFLMVAMFTSYWAWALWRLDPLLSLPLTVCLLFALGAATYWGLIRWILDAPTTSCWAPIRRGRAPGAPRRGPRSRRCFPCSRPAGASPPTPSREASSRWSRSRGGSWPASLF